jgi:hypothetical protein
MRRTEAVQRASIRLTMRVRLDQRIVRAALVLLFLGAAASFAAAQPVGTRPRTLLVIHSHIHSFAADNGRLAWVTGSDNPEGCQNSDSAPEQSFDTLQGWGRVL